MPFFQKLILFLHVADSVRTSPHRELKGWGDGGVRFQMRK